MGGCEKKHNLVVSVFSYIVACCHNIMEAIYRNKGDEDEAKVNEKLYRNWIDY